MLDKVLIPMYVKKGNHKYVHHDYSEEQMFFTTHHHIISDHKKQHKQKQQQPPLLGFNSANYDKIEAAKEAAQPIKRHHHFNDDDTTAIRCVGDGQHHRDDNH
jgi:hypothetical protein